MAFGDRKDCAESLVASHFGPEVVREDPTLAQ